MATVARLLRRSDSGLPTAPAGPDLNLPRMSVAEAELRNRFLRCVAPLPVRLESGALVSAPRLMKAADDNWMIFSTARGRVGFRALAWEGAPAAWPSSATLTGLAEVVATTSRFEALLDLLEGASGLQFELSAIGRPPPMAMQLDLKRRGRVLHRVQLAADSAVIEGWPIPPSAPVAALEARARVPLAMSLLGPSVPPSELDSLACGDLVFAPQGAVSSSPVLLTERFSGSRWKGALDIGAARISIHAVETWMDEPPSSVKPQPQDAGSPPGAADGPRRTTETAAWPPPNLPVTLSIQLPDISVAIGDLAALAPGGVLPCSFTMPGVPVSVKSGETEIARGRLIAVGTGYGVLVEAVVGGGP